MGGLAEGNRMPYDVYILRLENNHLYIGSTNDLTRRLAEHHSGCGRKSTA
jgi:predicted GIY-YIG superfamily endonuclease